jgi:hypothetical protein
MEHRTWRTDEDEEDEEREREKPTTWTPPPPLPPLPHTSLLMRREIDGDEGREDAMATLEVDLDQGSYLDATAPAPTSAPHLPLDEKGDGDEGREDAMATSRSRP